MAGAVVEGSGDPNGESRGLVGGETVINADGSVEAREGASISAPSTVLYIIGNEFCERFSYYGMRAILALFLNEVLKFTEAEASELVHLFIVANYFFPLIGAFISDSYTGKYLVILSLSTVYCLGNWLVALSAATVSYAWCLVGLTLITIGCGGIKPCVSSFGGDQIELTNPPGPARDGLLRWFFSYFYLAINVGSAFSMILVPIMRANLSYTSAFATPAVLMMLALFVFWLGRRKYVHQPPMGNVVSQVLQVIWAAASGPPRSQGDRTAAAASGSDAVSPMEEGHVPLLNGEGAPATDGGVGGTGEGDASLERPPPGAQPTAGGPSSSRTHETAEGPSSWGPHQGGEGAEQGELEIRRLLRERTGGDEVPLHWLDAAKGRVGTKLVEDVKQLLRVLLLFLPAPIFWSLFDQQSSRWVFQAERMDGNLFGIKILPDQMQVLNAVGIVAMIPLFDRLLYPAAERLGLSTRPITRMAAGMVLGGLSFFMTALVEVWIGQCPAIRTAPSVERHWGAAAMGSVPSGLPLRKLLPLDALGLLSANGTLAPTAAAPVPGPAPEIQPCVSLLWQVPQYLIITAGEIMFSITGLEFSYSQAPTTMTSVVSAAWLLTDSIGNLFTVFVIGSISPFLTQVQEFIFFGVMCILAMFLLLVVGRGFHYVQSAEES